MCNLNYFVGFSNDVCSEIFCTPTNCYNFNFISHTICNEMYSNNFVLLQYTGVIAYVQVFTDGTLFTSISHTIKHASNLW